MSAPARMALLAALAICLPAVGAFAQDQGSPAPPPAPAGGSDAGGAGTGGGTADGVPGIGPERMEAAVSYPVAKLQGLDKVTARISTFDAPVDQPVRFGSLTIQVRACWKNPPELTPESAAYLQIDDSTKGSDQSIFSGWMYASSPAVNGLEHPVYDVWVVDCLPAGGDAASKGGKEGGGEAVQGESAPKG